MSGLAKGFAFSIMAIGAFASAVMPAAAQDAPQGSPARQTSDMFDNSVKDSYYFERIFPKGLLTAKGEYADASRFATCSVGLDGDAARAVVVGDAGSDAEASAIIALAKRHRKCITSRAEMSPVILRGAFAEALWKKDGAIVNPEKRTSVDMSDIEAFFKASPHGDMANKAGTLPMAWVARCQAMALPMLSAKLLATIPGSDDEKTAAAALYAKSGVCGINKGLEATRIANVRASVADALYQNVARSKVKRSS